MGGDAGEGRGFSTGDSGGGGNCRRVGTRPLAHAASFLCRLKIKRFMDWALSMPSCVLLLACWVWTVLSAHKDPNRFPAADFHKGMGCSLRHSCSSLQSAGWLQCVENCSQITFCCLRPFSRTCTTLSALPGLRHVVRFDHLQEREALLAAQRREYEERRAAAAKNRAAAEEQLRGPAADVRPRKQWQDVEVSV